MNNTATLLVILNTGLKYQLSSPFSVKRAPTFIDYSLGNRLKGQRLHGNFILNSFKAVMVTYSPSADTRNKTFYGTSKVLIKQPLNSHYLFLFLGEMRATSE